MWGKVLGHDFLARAFARLVELDRLAHAYLFCGPEGVGKRLFAGELARALLCEKRGKEFVACGSCPACLQVAAESHPDYVVVRRPEDKHDLPIEIVRELCQGFGLKPARGRGRIAIVDDADDLNDESANCFLKTLEEPPPRSLLILIGSTPDQQLPTIRSRCQLVNFHPLPDADVRTVLHEKGITEEEALDRLVKFGRGSPGRALALADDALWEFRRRFLDSLVQRRFDAVGQMRAWTQFIEDAGKESSLQRRRASLLIGLVVDFFRQVLLIGSGASLDDANSNDAQLAFRLAEVLPVDVTLSILERLLLGAQQIERKVQITLVIEAMLDALGQQLQQQGERKK